MSLLQGVTGGRNSESIFVVHYVKKATPSGSGTTFCETMG